MKRLHPPSEHEEMVAEGKHARRPAPDQPALEEHWELTRLPDGTQIYRVTVGDGAALWHLMVAPDGRPDRLQVRLRDAQGPSFEATYTFFDHEWMIVSGQQGQKPRTEFLGVPPDGMGMLWEPLAGRELVLRAQRGRLYLLQQRPSAQGWLHGQWVTGEVVPAGREKVQVPAGEFEADSFTLVIPETPHQRIWVDSQGVVLQWQMGGEEPAQLTWLRRF